jgi:tetratricopeptide (TPR) repeat protein
MHQCTQAGQLDEAEKQYRLAIQLAPNILQFQFNLAKFLIDEEINVDEGVEIVDQILERAPGQWALLSYKGWGAYVTGLSPVFHNPCSSLSKSS